MSNPAGEPTKHERTAINRISATEDPERLRTFIENARRHGSLAVERAAFARLCEVQPSAKVGTVEHDVWRSIHALEEMLCIERGKTTRLSRTRQKIQKDGEAKTVADLVLKTQPTEGFQMLVKRGYPELLFEAVVLRHRSVFDQAVIDAANVRLAGAGLDPSKIMGAVQDG